MGHGIQNFRSEARGKASIAMGHLEIKGFEMHSGHMNEHGQEKHVFNVKNYVLLDKNLLKNQSMNLVALHHVYV